MTILRDLLSELTLWQKLCLLARIYWRKLVNCRIVKAFCLFGEALSTWFQGGNVDDVLQKENWHNRRAWQMQLAIALGDDDLWQYCTQEELDRWYEQDTAYGDPNPAAYAETLQARGNKWSKGYYSVSPSRVFAEDLGKPLPKQLTSSYVTGPTTQASYFVTPRTLSPEEVEEAFWAERVDENWSQVVDAKIKGAIFVKRQIRCSHCNRAFDPAVMRTCVYCEDKRETQSRTVGK